MRKPVIFFNVGWMRSYQGGGPHDKITGGGGYVAKHGVGGEICNFLAWRGWCYGYVQPPTHSDYINLDRIGADPEKDALDDVIVVWTATRPEGGAVVVGWYRDATVYRESQEIVDRTNPHVKRYRMPWFYAKAKAKNCHLIDPDNRWYEIPRVRPGKSGMGQSNVWFAEGFHGERWFKRLLNAINKGIDPTPEETQKKKKGRQPGKRGGNTRQSDPILRLRIEQAAIDAARKYFEAQGFKVSSVENQRCGWDLTCLRLSGRRHELHVEVKGSSTGDIQAELTPNEYALFNKRRPNYRLVVVTSALRKEKVNCFSWDKDENAWIANTNARLEVEKRTSAVVYEE